MIALVVGEWYWLDRLTSIRGIVGNRELVAAKSCSLRIIEGKWMRCSVAVMMSLCGWSVAA